MVHPCEVDDFADIYPDRSTRYYKVKRMRERRSLRFVGYNQTGGRPRDVYCNGWYPDKLEHELKLTKVMLSILKAYPLRVERGPSVDQRYLADADLFFPGGDTWRIEMDTGSQSYAQLDARWKVYSACPDFVLIVTCRRKLDEMLKRAAPYAGVMHFARYQEILKDPWGEVLVDAKREKFSLALSLVKGTD